MRLAVSTNALQLALTRHRFGGVWLTATAQAYDGFRWPFVMIFTTGGMAFVPNVFWLLVLRVLNGVFTGLYPKCDSANR